MIATAAGTAAWQGWVRSGEGAVFSLPETRDAPTTSWARAGGLFCVFTGHLYNRAALAAELAQEPDDTALSPAELGLAGYRRWGQDVMARLDGMFAVALWDQVNETLICARDPVGLHPFYYSLAGDELVFSWDLETLLRHEKVSRQVNRVVLAELLCGRLQDQEETFFAAVRRLPGGRVLRFARGRLEIIPYWDPVPSGRPVRWVTEEELPEFPRLLRNAVAATMQFGPLGIFLSGGFDSVSIAACAADIAGEQGSSPPQAYSVILSEEEGRIQRSVAKTLDMPQTFVSMNEYLDGHRFLGPMLDLVGNFPAPPLSFLAPPFLDLTEQAKNSGCRGMLIGDGGDEWLTVTPLLAADLIRAGNWSGLLQLARTESRRWGPSDSPLRSTIRPLLWHFGLRALARDWAWKHTPGLALRRRRQFAGRAVPGWMAPDPTLRRQLLERFENWNRQTADEGFYLKATRDGLNEPLKSICFDERFSRDQMTGIPSFAPYWHRPLVEFLIRTPPGLLNAGAQSKALARSFLSERLPQLGLAKQKKMVAEDLAGGILRRESAAVWRRVGSARSLVGLGVVDANRHDEMLRAFAESPHRLWYAASAEVWSRARL